MDDDRLTSNTIVYTYSYNTGFDLVKMLPDIAYLLYNMIHYLLQSNVRERMVLLDHAWSPKLAFCVGFHRGCIRSLCS